MTTLSVPNSILRPPEAMLKRMVNAPIDFARYSFFRLKLGGKYSFPLGFELSVRFSTGLIVQYVVSNSKLITPTLFSTLVATSIFMTPMTIGLYS